MQRCKSLPDKHTHTHMSTREQAYTCLTQKVCEQCERGRRRVLVCWSMYGCVCEWAPKSRQRQQKAEQKQQ